MKLKSLILGSVAAAGLSTAGYAADLGVLTSLDVCDALGLSGLTISSDTNCLQISGGVSYEFQWGDFNVEAPMAATFDGNRNILRGNTTTIGGVNYDNDWESKVEAWLKFVGTADSDFGPAKATIRLKSVERYQTWNEGQSTGRAGVAAPGTGRITNGDTTPGFEIDEAFVSVGDTTIITAGKKGSIANLGDDQPFNFLGLFTSDAIDGKGVGIDADYKGLGGHVIQVVSDLGNGFNVGVGLENLNGNFDATNGSAAQKQAASALSAGTLVGVVNYAGQGITAHLTGAAFGILDGNVESWAAHAGVTGSFDQFKLRAAASYWNNFKFSAQNNGIGSTGYAKYSGLGKIDVVNAMIGGQAAFDLFTLSVDAEVANVRQDATGTSWTDYGVGGSIGVAVTEGVSINLGARFLHDDINNRDTTQVAAQLVAAVTETVKITGEIGGYFGTGVVVGAAPTQFSRDAVYYGAAELAWNPGGGFTSSLKGELNSENSYRVTFKAAKSFE